MTTRHYIPSSRRKTVLKKIKIISAKKQVLNGKIKYRKKGETVLEHELRKKGKRKK
jgi:hypothetical protein